MDADRAMTDEQKACRKTTANFLQRSAARLERLLEINAPLIVVRREIEVAENRLRTLRAAFGVNACPFPNCECPPDSEGDVHCALSDGAQSKPARPLTREEEDAAWGSVTDQECSCCTAAVRLFCSVNGITLAAKEST